MMFFRECSRQDCNSFPALSPIQRPPPVSQNNFGIQQHRLQLQLSAQPQPQPPLRPNFTTATTLTESHIQYMEHGRHLPGGHRNRRRH